MYCGVADDSLGHRTGASSPESGFYFLNKLHYFLENKSLNFVLLRRQIDARVGRVTCYGTHVLLWDAGLERRVGTAPKPKVISIDLAPKQNPQSLPRRSSPKKKGRIGIHALPARVRDGSLQSAHNEQLSLLPQAQED